MVSSAFVPITPLPATRPNVSFAGTPISPVRRPAVTAPADAPAVANVSMASKGKFGPFTPAVLASKLILGEKRLNKLRGKGIAVHSQAIGYFCEFTGAGPRMRQNLIRLAKDNGNSLGFLS